MKEGKKFATMKRFALMLVIAIVTMFMGSVNSVAVFAKTAADYQLQVTTNRAEGVCNYQLAGLDSSVTSSFQLQVSYTDEKGQIQKSLDQNIALDGTNCVNGVYNGSFTMDQLTPFAYAKYTVSCIIDGVVVNGAQLCDFSVYSDRCSLKVSGNKTDAKRKVTMNITEGSDAVVPGKNNMASVSVWKTGSAESTAVKTGSEVAFAGSQLSWDMDMSTVTKGNGTYHAKVTVANGAKTASLGAVSFQTEVSADQFTTGKSAALEKKKAFSVTLKGVKSPVAIKNVNFHIYDKNDKVLYTQDAVDKNKNGKVYYAEIQLKDLKYQLDKFKIKAYITDEQGNTWLVSKTTSVDERASAKNLTVSKNKAKRNTTFRLKGAYIPGNVKDVVFQVYYKKSGKFVLLEKLEAQKNNNTYRAVMANKYAGAYQVYAYGQTNWGTKVLLKKDSFKILKGESAKNGWYYEKYNGKLYKFYYENNEKVKDLTKILGIKPNSNLYLEINRAASCVNVYAYDSVKKKYIIPVKTFPVSVGRDTYTNAGAGSLNTNSSFTPLGDYSICSNGQSVKYSVKPMYEPNGVTVYARWTTHIVGNVYFHSIAVGSNSHYALNPTTYNRLGSAASAGCIRMMVADAKWIYDYAATGSKVKIIKGDSSHPGPLGKGKTIKISGSIHYDPTDPEVPDSRKKSDYAAGLISGYMTKKGVRVGY